MADRTEFGTPTGFVSPLDQPQSLADAPVEGDDGKDLKREKSDLEAYALVMRLFEEGKKARKEYDGEWPKYRDFYNGNQWDKTRPAYRASPVINICRPDVQTVLPIMTDTEPGFNVAPREPSDFGFSKTLNEVVGDWWNKYSMSMTLINVLMDQAIYDAGIWKIVWDEDLEDGLGDVKVEAVDPERIYVPKDAIDFNRQCPWVIHELFRPAGKLARLNPDHAEAILRLTGESPQTSETANNPKDTTVHVVSPVDKPAHIKSTESLIGGTDESRNVRVLECWLDDYATEEMDLEDGTKETRRKYPKGRMIQVLPEGKIVTYDGENPYEGEKPFVRFVDTMRSRCFWGEGLIGPKMECQRIVNKIVANVMDYMTMMSNPVWVIDTNSGVDADNITNQIGLVIEKVPGTEVRRDVPPPLPAYYFQFYDTMLRFGDQVNGVHDVTQGRKPAGITAASAIQTLEEAAQTRIRLKERNLAASLHQAARLIVSRMLQFYDKPRVVKIAGKGGEWPEFFDFYVKKTEDGKYAYSKRGYTVDKATMQATPDANWQESTPSRGMFDLTVVTGVALPFMKSRMGDLALTLFDKKINDEQDVLDKLDYPDKEQLLQRKLEAAQAQPGAPTPGQQGPGMPPMPQPQQTGA